MITKSQIIICQKRNRSGNNIRLNIAWADKCGMINHVIKDMSRICRILIIFYQFWPKSLNWPLRPNVAIFDGISPFSREFEHFMTKYDHFWPKNFFYRIWPFLTRKWNVAISPPIWPFWQYLIYFRPIFDNTWSLLTKLVIFDHMIIFENDHSENVRFESC